MSHSHQLRADEAADHHEHGDEVVLAPGRLAAALAAAPTDVDVARQGVRGAGAPLPFLDRIQAAFGRHDVTGVRAHSDGAAAEAARDLGARAYATGSDVAFARAPDLHTAAHEAAHVVQQRAGVALKGGRGETGDVYERHADAVADLVVAGRSAEALLDRHAGGGGGAAVQLLSEDEELELKDLIVSEIDASGIYVPEKTKSDKLDAITSANSAKTGAKVMKDLRAEIRSWVKGLVAAKPKVQIPQAPPQSAPKPKAEPKPEHKAKADDVADDDNDTSARVEKPKPKAKGVDVTSQFIGIAKPALTSGWLDTAKDGAEAPSQPAVQQAAQSKAPAVIAKVKSWKPSLGHSGCKAIDLRTDELQEIVDTYASDSRYFIKKGMGTGDYKTKNQLKIIHKHVDAGTKKATFHITAAQGALDGVGIDVEDYAD
jgi:hypothetical protein